MKKTLWVSIFFIVALLSGCSGSETEVSPTTASNDAIHSLDIKLPVKRCEDLAEVDITSIGGEKSVLKTSSVVNSSCVVEGTLAPTINFKVQLPMESWTQRFMQVGCVGLCGRVGLMIGAAEGCLAVQNNNFVLASTDMGHQGDSGDFGNDPQKRIDFAYRAMHLTAVTSKVLIKELYGQEAKYSYFSNVI